jgi:hypothetical protein
MWTISSTLESAIRWGEDVSEIEFVYYSVIYVYFTIYINQPLFYSRTDEICVFL